MLNNNPMPHASGLSCGEEPTLTPEQCERAMGRARQKLRDIEHRLRRDDSAQTKQDYKIQLQKILGLVEQSAAHAPERMAPIAANMARHAIHDQDVQEAFAQLWKNLLVKQCTAGKDGALADEAKRQIDLFHQAEEQMGILRAPTNEAPFVRAAQSLIKAPACVISLSSKRQPSYTSDARVLARLAL